MNEQVIYCDRKQEITCRRRRVPAQSEQTVACLSGGLGGTQKVVGQSEEHQPVAVLLSAGKRGMGYETSSKFIGATGETDRTLLPYAYND